MEEYEIKAIAGTVDVEYQNIPSFPSMIFLMMKIKCTETDC